MLKSPLQNKICSILSRILISTKHLRHIKEEIKSIIKKVIIKYSLTLLVTVSFIKSFKMKQKIFFN